MSLSAQTIDPDMKKLLQVSGTEANFKNTISLITNSFKNNASFSSVPSDFWTEFAKEAEESYTELEKQIADVYKSHFSTDEIKQLIKFYESPIGKKYVQELPLIQSDSYKFGQEWGSKLGAKVISKLQPKKE